MLLFFYARLGIYERTRGAGSHAEVYAVNKALLANPGANIDDLLVYVISQEAKQNL